MQNKYIIRKNKELEVLRAFINDKSSKKFYTPLKIQEAKEKLIKKIKLKAFKDCYHDLSNKTKEPFITDKFIYSYTYERFNGFLNIPFFANNFYKISKKVKTSTYFTNCGMTSICSVLLALVSENKSKVNLLYEETYFETIKFINMITQSENDNEILYIDSIASEFTFNVNDILKYAFVVIDTTCFIGPQFKQMIEKIVRSGIPCILVRSHTKLDLLATEYSHLGSISFIFPNLKKYNSNFIDKVEQTVKHLIGVIGSCLPPDRFPPLILSKEVKAFNNIRIKIVGENNELFSKILNKSGINITLPNHKQFCLVYLAKDKMDLEKLKEQIYVFCKVKRTKYLTYPSVSFGFDYISIDCYKNFVDGTLKIRICLNDFPEEIIRLFSQDFIIFLNNLD